MKELVVKKSIEIKAPVSKVWDALTNPSTIKEWLYGTNTKSDWKVGSKILFTGNWNGTEYEDKGRILKLEAKKILKYNYWSSFSGLPDIPEYYSEITFKLTPNKKETKLTLTQTNFSNEEMFDSSEKNWNETLNTMKKVIEK